MSSLNPCLLRQFHLFPFKTRHGRKPQWAIFKLSFSIEIRRLSRYFCLFLQEYAKVDELLLLHKPLVRNNFITYCLKVRYLERTVKSAEVFSRKINRVINRLIFTHLLWRLAACKHSPHQDKFKS